MQWIELTISTSSAGIDMVGARLTALGFDSFIIDDQDDFHDFLENNQQYWDYVDEDLANKMEGLSQIRLYIEDTPDAPASIVQLRTALPELKEQFPTIEFGTLEIKTANRADEDWENNWKEYYQPIPIGERLIVVPQWMQDEISDSRIPVILDPGMIFGTGAHASTQMCMMALEAQIKGGERVIDLGSGSGILSIAALLLGAKSAIGVDIDPKAEDIARENAAMNNLNGDRFTAVTGNVIDDETQMRQLAEGGYEIVLANIVADVIIPLAPVVPHFLRPEGIFICSGILEVRVDEVRAALENAGLRIMKQNTIDDWCQLTAIMND